MEGQDQRLLGLHATELGNSRPLRDSPTVADDRRGSRVSTGTGFVRPDVLVVPKSGSTEDECEDAWSVNEACGRLAVSDGASGAFMSGAWARILTTSYVNSPPSPDPVALGEWLAAAAKVWRGEAPQVEVGWWAEEASARGAFATFLGVEILEGDEGTRHWSALAVGDTCLAWLYENEGALMLRAGFPIEIAAAFGGAPDLLGTSIGERGLPLIRAASGICSQGNVLLLMTDALAQWAFANNGNGTPAWELLVHGSERKVKSLIERAREDGSMVNDDVTLMRVKMG